MLIENAVKPFVKTEEAKMAELEPSCVDTASEYHFDITEYTNENYGRIEARIRNKGRGQTWDFF